MVNPIHIVSISLGVAFFLGFLRKANHNLTSTIMLLAFAANAFISAQWLWAFIYSNTEPFYIFTAGFRPPYSISLLMGRNEAIFTFLINIAGLLSGIFMLKTYLRHGVYAMMAFLGLILGLNIIILTRDLFNFFVFMEVSSIATAGMIILIKNVKSVSAGFKYIVASSLISILLLLGIVFIYYFGGSLNIDDMITNHLLVSKGAEVAVFLVLMSILLELKPFPANGWALDVYEGSLPGIGALLSATSATAVYFVLNKLLAFANPYWYNVVAVVGMISFIGSNLLGIKQKNAQRLLGYSSVGQIGLLLVILGFSNTLGEKFEYIAFGVLISHYLAKSGLFWLAGIVKQDNIKNWAALQKKPIFLFFMGVFLFTLAGFPPFPSFFAKWQLIMELSTAGMYAWVIGILFGSFLEAVYLFRWFGYAMKGEHNDLPMFELPWHKILPVVIGVLSVFGISYISKDWLPGGTSLNFIPLYFIAFMYLIDFAPAKVKNTIVILVITYYSWLVIPNYYNTDIIRLIFSSIFLIGAILTLIPGYLKKGSRKGFYPAALLMFSGLIGLVESTNIYQFFFSWELMTIGSYLLIIRGKYSMPHAFKYLLFSVGGAYFMLMGFGMAHAGQASLSFDILRTGVPYSSIIFLLIAIGFMTKLASLGFHIWLPGAYGESEADVAPMVSSILINAGVFGFIILMTHIPDANIGYFNIPYMLGWIGVISALVGNIMASLQEDARKLVAYSSIGVMGYVLFGMAMMSHLGWLTAITYTINHFLFKGLLFLAIGGVILRTKTFNMYEMGGLIKKMPWSFIAVLIGIITLAGIPPLSGYAGKWLFYNAIVLKGWYIQGAFIMFAGIIAFLYCFRLIYAIFLGQLKDEHRNIKEASVWFIIPQYIIIITIMLFSAFPQYVLNPIGNWLSQYFPNNALVWNGSLATSSLGYWNAFNIMMIVMGMFVVLLLFLLLVNRGSKKVGQFDIVYAAERPERPETTHMAYNLYAHYNKAIGFLITPWITKSWDNISEWVNTIANHTRKIYNGNGQAYALHILIYIVIAYLIINGGLF
ncbi:MAG: NADH-quinone oxidoreductase subunit F [Chlorobi bacterium]|nr:NADH-quinone oxidoreductase subunit F [Chlorobiota bacterium]